MAVENKLQNKVSDIASAAVTVALGMASTNKGDIAKLGIMSGRELLKGHFKYALSETYKYFLKKGSISEEYFSSPDFADLSPEFEIVSDSNFGKNKLDTLRKIFVNLALDTSKDSNKKYLLDIALGLTEPQIKILIADFELAQKETITSTSIADLKEWRDKIAELSGLEHHELVQLHDDRLVDFKLINPERNTSSGNIFVNPGRSRLTGLGYSLCSLMLLEDDPIKS